MREVTSLHLIPYHPENYKTIYDYDSFLDSNLHLNRIFVDRERLKNTYGVENMPFISNEVKYPSIKNQMKLMLKHLFFLEYH